MNSPSIAKILPGNIVRQGSVVVKSDMEGNTSINALRARINDVDITNGVGPKYNDRFTDEDHYGN